jgi:hypothetical protein
MAIPQKEGEFVIKGCEYGIVATLSPKLIAKTFRRTMIHDGCFSGDPKEGRKLQHVIEKRKYQGTSGCEGCKFHKLGTEPKEPLLTRILEHIAAF